MKIIIYKHRIEGANVLSIRQAAVKLKLPYWLVKKLIANKVIPRPTWQGEKRRYYTFDDVEEIRGMIDKSLWKKTSGMISQRALSEQIKVSRPTIKTTKSLPQPERIMGKLYYTPQQVAFITDYFQRLAKAKKKGIQFIVGLRKLGATSSEIKQCPRPDPIFVSASMRNCWYKLADIKAELNKYRG